MLARGIVNNAGQTRADSSTSARRQIGSYALGREFQLETFGAMDDLLSWARTGDVQPASIPSSREHSRGAGQGPQAWGATFQSPVEKRGDAD